LTTQGAAELERRDGVVGILVRIGIATDRGEQHEPGDPLRRLERDVEPAAVVEISNGIRPVLLSHDDHRAGRFRSTAPNQAQRGSARLVAGSMTAIRREIRSRSAVAVVEINNETLTGLSDGTLYRARVEFVRDRD
jgi:hypothetical protein